MRLSLTAGIIKRILVEGQSGKNINRNSTTLPLTLSELFRREKIDIVTGVKSADKL